jgi:hypothetical protein
MTAQTKADEAVDAWHTIAEHIGIVKRSFAHNRSYADMLNAEASLNALTVALDKAARLLNTDTAPARPATPEQNTLEETLERGRRQDLLGRFCYASPTEREGLAMEVLAVLSLDYLARVYGFGIQASSFVIEQRTAK